MAKKSIQPNKKSKSDNVPPVRQKSTPGNSKNTPKASFSLASLVQATPTEQHLVDTRSNSLWKTLFWASTALGLVILLAGALNSGINADDMYQVDYSQKLLNYYQKGDTAALNVPKGNMHYYGGLFDVKAGLVNQWLGYDEFDAGYHNVRHTFNALFGFLIVLFVGLSAVLLGGYEVGVAAVVLAILSPHLLGHSFMNPKDIPFAAGFAMAAYFLFRLLKTLPQLKWYDVVGLGIGMGIAIGTRAGGLLVAGYVGLFLGLKFLFDHGLQGIWKEPKIFGKYAVSVLGSLGVGYLLAISTWPAALEAPFTHVFEALKVFTKYPVRIRVLFAGENIMSDTAPWYYPITWIWKTLPLSAIVGVLAGIPAAILLMRRYGVLQVGLIFFGIVFPVFYIIYSKANVYDGWRHLLFIYPFVILATALFWHYIASRLQDKIPYGRLAGWGLAALLTLDAGIFIARNFAYPYTYFNPLSGGIKGAYGEYETDYWGVSVKQALDWMEQEGILSPSMPDSITLASTFIWNVERQLKPGWKVRPRYVRHNSRYDIDWDYAIFPTRFIRGKHLKGGYWPTSKTIHTLTANGVPITAIEKETTHLTAQGQAALVKNDIATATTAFQNEVKKHPDNELAWLALSNIYLSTGNVAEAEKMAKESLKVAPDNESGLYYLGIAQVRTNPSEALNNFEKVIKLNDGFFGAFYYAGTIYQQRGDLVTALNYAIKAIQGNQRYIPAYELAASIYEAQGDTQRAQQFRGAIQQLQQQ